MIEEFQSLNAQNDERTLEISKILVKAAKETHAVITKSEAKCSAARRSIATRDKDAMWQTLQEYIRDYADFINSMSAWTGIVLHKVDKAMYDQLSPNDVENQLQIMIGFVYAKEAMDSVFQEPFKQCVEKFLKQSKLFDNSELKRPLF